MRERELDEFGSLFQRAVIPTIEVEKIAIDDIVVLADFSERAAACGRVAAELKRRFGARVSVRFLLSPGEEDQEATARRLMDAVAGDEHRLVEGDPLAHLEEITEREKPSLILAPAPLDLSGEPAAGEALGRFVDDLLVATAIPTLLIRKPVDGSIFRRILATIPGGRPDLIEQFSFAFALCPPGGHIRLLHVLEQDRLAELAEVLEIAPGIDTAHGGKELMSALQARMNHLLRGAVRTAEDAAFTVEASLEAGDPMEVLPRYARDATLLIVGSQASHRQFLASRAYELIRRVPDIPVLAL